jgi:hypothetical protein
VRSLWLRTILLDAHVYTASPTLVCCTYSKAMHKRESQVSKCIWADWWMGPRQQACSAPQRCKAAAQVSEKALAQTDAKAALRAVMKSWLPLSEAVLGMAVEELPDPVSAAPERLPRLLALDALSAPTAPVTSPVQQVSGRMSVFAARPSCVGRLQSAGLIGLALSQRG